MFLFLNPSVFIPLPLFISLLLLVIYIKCFSSPSTKHKNLPPSPWKLPVIGNLHQLGSSYHRSLSKLAQKHGPFMLLDLGIAPVLVASSADAAQEIMKTNELMFSRKSVSKILRKLTYDSKFLTFSHYGDYWRQVRSFFVLHLLSSTRVQSFQQVRGEEIDLMMNMIEESSGSVVNLSKLIFSLSSDVVCRITLGKKYGGKNFKDLVHEYMRLVIAFSFGRYIPWLSWVDELRGLNGQVEKMVKELDEFLEGVIEEHLHKKRKESTGGKIDMVDETQHIIDILLEQKEDGTSTFDLQRDTIKAIILEMFLAASDTTFTALEWAFSELVRNPPMMKKLQKEVILIAQGKPKITEDDLEKLQYLDAVLKETLRLHPPAPLLLRESTQDGKIKGYDIEARTEVFINVWAIGRDPAVWVEPEEFKPDRFLNSHFNYNGSHFEYIPFGSGRRGCPGLQFAKILMKLALANVLYKFDLALPDGRRGEDLDMSETIGITVSRKSPLLLVATPHSKM